MNKLTLKKITAGAITVLALAIFVMPVVVSAQTDAFGLGEAQIPGLGTTDLRTSINAIIGIILSFLGIVAVLIILWGGFLWMTAGGDETKVDKARKLIISGIVGIVIILSAYIIANFVITAVGEQLGADV